MNHLRIAVLRGGPSAEYDVSMKTGSNVLAALRELGYSPIDVTITKKGEWLESGMVKQPDTLVQSIDMAFIALHGVYGEDGKLQRLLQQYKVAFNGSNALASSMAINKILTKEILAPHGIRSPQHYRVTRDDIARLNVIVPHLNAVLGQELFIKPVTEGSSLGAATVTNEASLKTALEELLQDYEEVMVEEFIRGREATVAILEEFRNEKHYALPVVEIVPPSDDPVFSYENKYNGRTQEICPGRFSYREKAELEAAARLIHETLNCTHYSRSDFLVRDGEIYFLEVNTLPGLTSESLFPVAAAAVGMDYKQLIDHLVRTARY